MPALDHLAVRLDGTVARFREQWRIPGIVAGVVLDQELAWSCATGFADLATGAPVTASTCFRIASVTKTFTATAILQLRDEGRLSLDDPLVRHVPEFAAVRNPFGPIDSVTLRGLLTHTSGLQYLAPAGDTGNRAVAIEGFVTRAELLGRLPRAAIVIPPGTWNYSNLAYELLGEVIERVSGTPLGTYVQANLLDPLELRATSFDPAPEARAHCAVGHRSDGYEERTPPAVVWRGDWVRAAGGLWSDLGDMAAWIGQQFRTGPADRRGARQVLDGPSLAEMHRATVLKDDAWTYAQGLGWASLRRGELTVLSHSGGLPGWRTNVLFRPADRFGVIVLLNAHGDAPGLGLDLAEIVWETAHDLRSVGLARQGGPGPCPTHLREYLGTYHSRDTRYAVRVECRDGRLVMVSRPVLSTMPDVVPLDPTGRPDEFMPGCGAEHPGEPTFFTRDARGRVTRLVLGGEAHLRVDAVEPDALS